MAADCFLKIDDIPGESTDDKHDEWIEILSFNHGVSQTAGGSRSTSGGATEGRCDHQDFSVVKNVDRASPSLNLACCEGRPFDEIIFQMCTTSGMTKEPYLVYTMHKAIISSVSIGGGGGGGLPTESVTFNYGKVTWYYQQMNHETGDVSGNVEKYWNVVKDIGG